MDSNPHLVYLKALEFLNSTHPDSEAELERLLDKQRIAHQSQSKNPLPKKQVHSLDIKDNVKMSKPGMSGSVSMQKNPSQVAGAIPVNPLKRRPSAAEASSPKVAPPLKKAKPNNHSMPPQQPAVIAQRLGAGTPPLSARNGTASLLKKNT